MISSKIIENAVYDLCVQANTTLNDDVFAKILDAYNKEDNEDAKYALQLILTNAKMAYEKQMPLCQDTGQVLVFVKGKCFPDDFYGAINKGVTRAYEENFYRKSVVKNAIFDRINTKTNTPCVIYTEISDKNEIEIELLIKGGGSENISEFEMLSPTASEDELVEFVVSAVKKAGAKGCPPYFIGVGIGGTMEYAGLLSKKALLLSENIDDNHKNLAEKIKNAVNELNIGAAGLGGASTALDVKLLTAFTHIACMPVAVTINCHSFRHAKCTINEPNTKFCPPSKLSFSTPHPNPLPQGARENNHNQILSIRGEEKTSTIQLIDFSTYLKVNTSDINVLKSLKQGQNILLSGVIYTARDMAHKRLLEMTENGEELPFDIKNKIIFYAGPCPSCASCVIGSIGPTTASRMDKFAPTFYRKGLLATIGKGERSEEVKAAIKETGGLYFTAIGGIACYLSEKFIKKDLIAFEDLGTEAIYRFEVRDLPLRVEFS